MTAPTLDRADHEAQHSAALARQYCTFWVDGLHFGISVEHVQEVLRYQQMTGVPCAPEAVLGLINLRGQIVTALDLRCRLGLPSRGADELPMNVIVRSRGEVVSLLVDDIGDVMDADEFTLQPAPANMPATVQDVVTGVLPLADSILLVLDADAAVDVSSTEPNPGGPS
ncbi:chemotaxis protein CheW [Nocardioides sp. R-C-SC26]|uniref:chemotaxis protein CheW n=1 Tax=Nocardioides sp. R-C-SC26 TaxID=2870414 RepID=UPI001E4CCE06|nr:chemotaxis protein CheW [Nocardioides sp. R-C-SC26]